MRDNSDLDRVILVNSDDKEISQMDKYQAHEHPAKLHRAVSVWLINDEGKVLLQKRSIKKIVGATWWANAICGNVRPGENYSDCAKRRLKEEIGIIDAEIKPIYKFVYKAYGNEKYSEYEMDQVFVGKYDGNVVPSADEVSEVSWIDLDELLEQIEKFEKTGPLIISPEKTLIMNLEQLKKYTAPRKVMIDGKDQLLTPWTDMMLEDKRLIKELKNI